MDRLALPVANLALHSVLGPGDLRHQQDRPQQPGGDEARHEAGQRQDLSHGACTSDEAATALVRVDGHLP
jgi:hypothetical protein